MHVLEVAGISVDELSAKSEESTRIGFLLSDDQPFTEAETALIANLPRISLGQRWLQGHSCITIIHHSLDSH